MNRENIFKKNLPDHIALHEYTKASWLIFKNVTSNIAMRGNQSELMIAFAMKQDKDPFPSKEPS